MPEELTPEQVKKDKELCEKATPGPWRASAPDVTYHDVIRIYGFARSDLPVAICPQMHSAGVSVLLGTTNETTEAAYNGALIARTRSALPQYISRVEHDAAALEEARQAEKGAITALDEAMHRLTIEGEKLAASRAECERLRDALSFYANVHNYQEDGAPGNRVGTAHGDEWENDEGSIARKALEAKP